MAIQAGEIYLAPIGGKQRPVVIVSRAEFNYGSYAVVVPFTTKQIDESSKQPNCVAFRAGEFGLDKDCVAQAEAIAQFEIAELDAEAGPIGRLDDERMREIILAIGYVIGATCEPN